ncbi:hypothetical protein [Salinisphaera sp. G21_0]|uniref:hypothetical protein n=1 Tax=Salinisphaera sp. G21_0 TaxID=2821094 RepID=UPI001ADB5410|nr:hypothetical protein [Salinisphaera sp. G21_0]MBO9483809.1 hypothetical protein [Salinisphaera sp. G21_0]
MQIIKQLIEARSLCRKTLATAPVTNRSPFEETAVRALRVIEEVLYQASKDVTPQMPDSKE